MTIEKAIEILNLNKHRDRDNWELDPYGPQPRSVTDVISESELELWFELSKDDAIMAAKGYLYDTEVEAHQVTAKQFVDMKAYADRRTIEVEQVQTLLAESNQTLEKAKEVILEGVQLVDALRTALEKTQTDVNDLLQIVEEKQEDLEQWDLIKAEFDAFNYTPSQEDEGETWSNIILKKLNVLLNRNNELSEIEEQLTQEREAHKTVKQEIRDLLKDRTEMTEINPTLISRLRGVYNIPINDGAGPLYGETVFTRVHQVPPIHKEAANALEAALDEIASLRHNYDMLMQEKDGEQ